MWTNVWSATGFTRLTVEMWKWHQCVLVDIVGRFLLLVPAYIALKADQRYLGVARGRQGLQATNIKRCVWAAVLTAESGARQSSWQTRTR